MQLILFYSYYIITKYTHSFLSPLLLYIICLCFSEMRIKESGKYGISEFVGGASLLYSIF